MIQSCHHIEQSPAILALGTESLCELVQSAVTHFSRGKISGSITAATMATNEKSSILQQLQADIGGNILNLGDSITPIAIALVFHLRSDLVFDVTDVPHVFTPHLSQDAQLLQIVNACTLDGERIAREVHRSCELTKSLTDFEDGRFLYGSPAAFGGSGAPDRLLVLKLGREDMQMNRILFDDYEIVDQVLELWRKGEKSRFLHFVRGSLVGT